MRALPLAIGIVVSLASACKKDEAAPATGDREADTDGRARRAGTIAKINVYVACLNNLDPVVRRSRDSYFEWVDPEKGPTGKEKRVGGVSEVLRESTYGFECFKRDGGLDAVDRISVPLEDLDRAGGAYRKAALEVLEVTKTARAYYEHGDYKDDGFAQGKELHGSLVETFRQFDRASAELSAALQEVQDRLAEEDLAELERSEGKKAHWHHGTVMQKAKLLVRAVTADPVDRESVTAAGEAFASAYKALKEWTEANQSEASKNVHWNNFVRYSEELLIQHKELERALRDGKDAPASSDGSVASLIGKYNQLVELSNNMW